MTIHVVTAGQTLYAIGELYGVSPGLIARYNNCLLYTSHSQQIYSLSPLATREIPHMQLERQCLELVDGLEPPTC